MATIKEDKTLPKEEASLEEVKNGIADDGNGSDE